MNENKSVFAWRVVHLGRHGDRRRLEAEWHLVVRAGGFIYFQEEWGNHPWKWIAAFQVMVGNDLSSTVTQFLSCEAELEVWESIPEEFRLYTLSLFSPWMDTLPTLGIHDLIERESIRLWAEADRVRAARMDEAICRLHENRAMAFDAEVEAFEAYRHVLAGIGAAE